MNNSLSTTFVLSLALPFAGGHAPVRVHHPSDRSSRAVRRHQLPRQRSVRVAGTAETDGRAVHRRHHTNATGMYILRSTHITYI